MFKELPEARMQYPRMRSAAVTDSDRYIYILGSSKAEGVWKVERFCTKTNQVDELADMPRG